MATLSKTQNTDLVAFAELSSTAVTVGTAVDVSTKAAAQVLVWFGRCAATALTQPFEWRIETAIASSGSTPTVWVPFAVGGSNVAAAADEAVSGTCNSGQKVIAMASTTGFSTTPQNAGQLIFIRNTTAANSEWARVNLLTSNTSVTVEENLVNAQTGSTVYGDAQFWSVYVPLDGVGRIRGVANNSASGQTVAFRMAMVTFDSIG